MERRKKMPIYKILLISFLAIVAVAIISVVVDAIYCNMHIDVTKYKIKSNQIKKNYRIVLISDLHNKEFGENNIRLINKIKEQNPDFIVVAGDMIQKHEQDISVAYNLLTEIAEFTDVYYGLGNHEKESLNPLNEKGAPIIDTMKIFENTKVHHIDNEYCLINDDIVIGAMSQLPILHEEREFYDDLNKKSEKLFSILIYHQPEQIGKYMSNDNIDLILSGHTHGGQFRIPFIGGVMSPNQGFFPKYDKGLFEFEKSNLIISSGLGNSHKVPRLNNPPEIVVIEIEKEHKK